MALVDNAWYIDYGDGSTTGYFAVAAWAASTAYSAGDLRKQTSPTAGNERVFVCVVAGTSGGTEPTWVLTRGAKTTDNTITWQEVTGVAGVNGDVTNTPNWTTIKNTAVSLGQVIKRDSAASYQICTTAGTAGNGTEPAFSNTAGTTTTDNTVTWTSLGVVGNFTGWQAPHARLENSFGTDWGQAGNSFFISNSSAQTQGSALTITVPGTASSPVYVYSVTKTTVPPTNSNVSTGASIATTGASSINISGAGAYWNGVTFSSGSGASLAGINTVNTSNSVMIYDNCVFTINNTNASRMNLSSPTSGGSFSKFYNCTFNVADNTSGGFYAATVNGSVEIYGGIVNVGANVPNNLFNLMPSTVIIDGLDISALGSGKTIITNTTGANTKFIIFKNCKLGASVTKANNPTLTGQKFIFINSDSGATNYTHDLYTTTGNQSVESTIVRSGGATDGVTPISWKIDTNTAPTWSVPFETLPIAVWNKITGGSITLTVYGIWGGGAVPNNDDIWMEISYLSSSSTPISTTVTTTKANTLVTATALSSDTSTWGGSTTKFKMASTFTPQMKGYIYVRIKVAKISSTFYIDPLPVIS